MNWDKIRSFIVEIGEEIADYAFHKLSTESASTLSSVHTISNSDTIYQIDRHAEEVIVKNLKSALKNLVGLYLLQRALGKMKLASTQKDFRTKLRTAHDHGPH